MLSAPAFAQDSAAADQNTADDAAVQSGASANDGQSGGEIVVTGSILRQTDEATPSPITVLNTEDLDSRGISTVQGGLQQLTSNNGPAITNSFSANGAFAAGASAVSLRGLTTNSTLVLFDGMRAAYYPLADDGTRNFVDLNTIPDDIVDHVDVLRDGASSSYGADAIAGVVNIVTKREFKGVIGRAEAGVTERGDAPEYRMSLTAGTGDLDDDGYNAYVSGFYYRSDALANKDRPYPYNTDDLRDVCNDGNCGPNNIVNGLNGDGNFREGTQFGASPFIVAPYDAANETQLGRYQQLETNLCRGLPSYDLTAGDLAATDDDGELINANAPTTVCQEDFTNLYGTIQPEIERFGGSARFTAKINDVHEAYAEFNFMQSRVGYYGSPQRIRTNANAGIDYPPFSTVGGGAAFADGSGAIALPVYVCPVETDGACNAENGELNPNNPFADEGQVARIAGRIPGRTYNETRNRAYRAAMGINGPITDNVDYSVKATAMHNDLRRLDRGYVYIQHLLDVVRDGSYNFLNPMANSQETMDYLTPDNITNASSDLYQVEGTVSAGLFELPGGTAQLGVGGSIRYEAVDAPSANPDYNGPTERYFTMNAFGVKGHRTVYSAFAEIDAPVMTWADINLSGRYDKYSSGQSTFSPKVGVKFQPIPELVIRGTYSEGFRIPSFGEANSLPTTGYVSNSSSTFPDEYLQQYGCSQDTFADCPTYIRNSSTGLTTTATPDLKPEKSRSFTAGVVIQPVRNITLTADYYNIKKTDAITSAPASDALDAYYTGQGIPDGYTVTPDSADPNHPDALPRVAFVESGFINANTIRSEGIDFSGTATFDIGSAFTWTLAGQASYIINLSTELPDGTVQSYEGTLGNFALTAGSGTPEWRGMLQSTFDFGGYSLTATGNYFDGYDLSAEDQGVESGSGGLAPSYTDTKVDSYTTVDLVNRFDINDKYSLYLSVLNVFDELPPIDPVTYGAHLYNPVQGGQGILGRTFKAGVKFKL